MSSETIFFSYSRDDSEFVLNLAKNLRKAGANIWLDQLDIEAGTRWDSSIERALNNSNTLLVILSDTSVVSHNVLDEVSYALEENKKVVPVLLEECDIPFRLRRLQYADFTVDHKTGIATLIRALNLDENVAIKLADVAIEDPSEAKKVKQQTIQAEKKKPVPVVEKTPPIKTVQPQSTPQQQASQPRTQTHYTPPPRAKSSNSFSYLIGGIVLGGIGLLILIILIIAYNYDDSSNDIYNPDPYDFTIDDGSNSLNTGTETLTQHDKDWNLTLATNTLQGYMDFLYKYGKKTSHYQEVYTNIYAFLPNRAYAMYGINYGDRYFNKLLWYLPATSESVPMADDIISPSFATQLSNDVYYSWNGVNVQPGHRLVVLDVYIDESNVIWAKVGY